MSASYILALNCGSSSIKARLFALPSSSSSSSSDSDLEQAAKLSASGIGAGGGKEVELELVWTGKDEPETRTEDGDAEYSAVLSSLLSLLTSSDSHPLEKSAIKVVAHRVVHGSTHSEPIVVTNGHREGLSEMDRLSTFAPLHNHNAVLAVRSVLDLLPEHTSVLLFDTLFHQTLDEHVYTYAVGPAEQETPVPLRKYGFHGLSYASLLSTLSSHLSTPASSISAVMAHLGSGGSVSLVARGESKDTSMGLTPLEGLVGGTRSGDVDPTLVFHHTKDCAANALDEGEDRFISKAEMALNKESGLKALAGTADFGLITRRMERTVDCSDDEAKQATLAYNVYLDRLLKFISFYLFKLLALHASGQGPAPQLVFSGGIGERSARLRKDVVESLAFLGVKLDREANEAEGRGQVKRIGSGGEARKVDGVWVIETDEELQCAKMARAHLEL